MHFLKNINIFLGITTPLISDFKNNLSLEKNERLISLCQQFNSNDYFTGSSAKAYLEEPKFKNANINVQYFDYEDYPQYEQLHGKFNHHVSILDLLFCEGHHAKKFMKSFPENA